MHDGQYLEHYLKEKGIKVAEVVRLTGIPRPTIYTHLNRHKLDMSIKNKYTSAIGVTWPGNMVAEPDGNYIRMTPRKTGSNARIIGDLNETEFEDGSRFRQISSSIWSMNVELVTEKAKAGWLSGFADPEYHDQLPHVEILVDFVAKGKYLAFEATGDSMNDGTIDSIPHKSIILGRELEPHKWKPRLHSHDWPNWIFVHRTDGILVKQIADQNLDEGWIIHHSLNPNKELYPDEKIWLKDIYRIYNVVKRQLP